MGVVSCRSVTSLPAGFKVMTMAVGSTGPSQGVIALGQTLQSFYKKNASESRAADHTLHTLGFSTDNGAYFYGKPETNKDFEQTIIDMQSYHS